MILPRKKIHCDAIREEQHQNKYRSAGSAQIPYQIGMIIHFF